MMKIRGLIPQKAINYGKHLPLAALAFLFHRFPSKKLKIIGVTGTDGKTTTVSLIYHLLKEAGYPVGMVSTVSARTGKDEIDTGFHVTSPNPWLLQKLLGRMAKEGVGYLVLEVTSHGLDQFRLFGIDYELGVLTNISHEHLDYHKNLQNYQEAKARLFDRAKIAVLNADDESFNYFSQRVRKKGGRVISYGIRNKVDFSPQTFSFDSRLPGEHNRYNCLAAIAVASTLGVSSPAIRKALASFEGVVGRMEEIKEGQDFKVLVDFAHTPNALRQTLVTLRKTLPKGKRLIVVFGSAGLRDRKKRPLMGQVASQYADLAVITAEDPRTEKVEDICRQITGGFKESDGKSMIITNRQEAIEFAIENARAGDIVVVCGKGHEKSMCFGTKEYPWSDQEAAKKALRKSKEVVKNKVRQRRKK